MVSTMCPTFIVQCGKILSFFTLQKGQERVKVKTTGCVHNFIIPQTVETMIEGQSETVQ